MTEKENPAFVERFTVRMPDGLRDAVAAKAKANGRSMNSEIVAALEAWLSGDQLEVFSEKDVARVIRIATKTLAEEISKNYNLVPKVKDE